MSAKTAGATSKYQVNRSRGLMPDQRRARKKTARRNKCDLGNLFIYLDLLLFDHYKFSLTQSVNRQFFLIRFQFSICVIPIDVWFVIIGVIMRDNLYG